MKNAIIYTFVFLAIQVMAGFIVDGIWRWALGKGAMNDATGIIVTTMVFTVISVTVFLLAKWCEVSRHWIRKRPWVMLLWCAIAAIGAIIPSVWIQEHMPELPNIAEDTFDMILRDRWGYVAVGLLAPLAEELVFRAEFYSAESQRFYAYKFFKGVLGIRVDGAAAVNIAAHDLGCPVIYGSLLRRLGSHRQQHSPFNAVFSHFSAEPA